MRKVGTKHRFILLLIAGIVMPLTNYAQKKVMEPNTMKIFLCGDVMLARGIEQSLPHSVDPVLYESYVNDARQYIQLAEMENGKIDLPISYRYLWGDALKAWKENKSYLRLINLETSVTTHDIPWKI